MLQQHSLWKALIPRPYNFMSRIRTFETGRTWVDPCLWMVKNQESWAELARLEWKVEQCAREDLFKQGFSIKQRLGDC